MKTVIPLFHRKKKNTCEMCKDYFSKVGEHLKATNEASHCEVLSNMQNIMYKFLVKRKRVSCYPIHLLTSVPARIILYLKLMLV